VHLFASFSRESRVLMRGVFYTGTSVTLRNLRLDHPRHWCSPWFWRFDYPRHFWLWLCIICLLRSTLALPTTFSLPFITSFTVCATSSSGCISGSSTSDSSASNLSRSKHHWFRNRVLVLVRLF
jgi:hypothetical protein